MHFTLRRQVVHIFCGLPSFQIGGLPQVQGHPKLIFAIIRLVPVIYLTEFAFTYDLKDQSNAAIMTHVCGLSEGHL